MTQRKRRNKRWVFIFILAVAMLFAVTAFAASGAEWDDPVGERNFTYEEWAAVNYTLYHVNAGCNETVAQQSPTTAQYPGDRLGIYQTRTEGPYGAAYGLFSQSWGYAGATITAGTATSADKALNSRTVNTGTSLTYRFDIPVTGEYYVTVGSRIASGNDRWFTTFINGVDVSGSFFASSRYLREITYKVSVAGGTVMDVEMRGSGTAYPVINFITVQKTLPATILTAAIDGLESELAKTDYYTEISLKKAAAEYKRTKEIYEANKDTGPVTDLSTLRLIRGAFVNISNAKALLRPINAAYVPYTQFNPGALWYDTDGALLHAHGPGIIWDETMQKYYWYGENRNTGRGVNCYSSNDLMNWDFEGWALRGIPSIDSFDNDPYFNGVYGGNMTYEEKLAAFEGVRGVYGGNVGYQMSRNTERPKCIYNDKTGYYVMWMHLEGYTNANGGDAGGYANATSAVAVSRNPEGPFRFLRSYRMDRCPPGKQDSYPQDVGMARDMTLFVDDDAKAYHIFASEENSTLHISLLSDDYLSHAGKYIRVFENRWHEAPAICKHQGRYWLLTSACTGWDPNAARAASAPSIWGPWEEFSNPCRGVNPANGLGPEKTFGGQSTFILPVRDTFIAMFDIWRSDNAIDGRYIWLPMRFEGDGFTLTWTDTWTNN